MPCSAIELDAQQASEADSIITHLSIPPEITIISDEILELTW